MVSLHRTVSLYLFFTTTFWSCQASHSRIRRRDSYEEKSTPKQRGQIENGASRNEQHRELSTNSTTCAAIAVDGFPSCAAFCENQTGYSLNTFIEMEQEDDSKQYCCACFSGDAYCSDDIPECVDYVNLDFGGQSINWDYSGEKEDANIDVSMNVSCVDVDVTSTLACLDFCEVETGDATSEYRGISARDRYFCVCSSTLVPGGHATYCSDNMSDRWRHALSNTTVLSLSTRAGVMP